VTKELSEVRGHYAKNMIVALRTLQGKREPGPKRKHGNIPL
jgi:hypothetical protein